MIVTNEDFVKKNYDKTTILIEKYNLDALGSLLSDFAEEYATAPASTKKDYFCAFTGGLTYHNLCVLKWLGRFSAAIPESFSKESMVKLAILHDFGKVGTKDAPYYLPTNDKWKIDKGIYYDINPDLQYMKIPHRSLFLAQEAKVPLTQEEYLALMLVDGQNDEGNAYYRYKEPKLAALLHQSVHWSRKVSKELVVKRDK